MTDALIHLRVPAATKAAWVRASRAEGLRLGDWIVRRVERPHADPCPRCGSHAIVPDGQQHQCADCGLVA